MKPVKHYAERDIMALDEAGGFYIAHVSAMTSEKLHSKSDIAAELGHRDMQIDSVTTQLAEARQEAATWEKRCVAETGALRTVTDERDALAAQVEALRTTAINVLEAKEPQTRYKAYNALAASVKSTPAACLAQVQAEAGRAGFVAALSMHGNPFQLTHSRIAELADQHAERIRQGVK